MVLRLLKATLELPPIAGKQFTRRKKRRSEAALLREGQPSLLSRELGDKLKSLKKISFQN